MGLVSRLKHAFAVDPPGPAEPTPAQQPAIDRVCREIARRRLSTVGLIGLEMSRPLNYLGAQLLHVAAPGVWAIVQEQTYESYMNFTAFLERRGSIDYLCRRIEHFEQEYERSEREAAAAANAPRSEEAP